MADSILVLGATGTIGQLVVSELVTKGETVKAAALDGQTHPDASVLRFDYRDPASIAPLFEGVDRVFVLMPSAPLDVIAALMPVMRHVVDRKVKAVLLSTIAADTSEDNPYRRLELVLENSGLPFVILRANWFADNFRTVWKDAIRTGELELPTDEGLISFVDGRDVAAAAAAALTSSDFDGQTLVLTGPAALPLSRATEVMSHVMGRPVVFRTIAAADYEARLAAEGLPEKLISERIAEFETIRGGKASIVSPAVEKMTGRPPRFFETFVKDHATDFVGT
ncbi:NAD(P)H azoreductase [Pleomorphomonas sp. T1.2MG-36]|uniref:NmrA family NAD(P)-binding protein n=1 Tax=Pleomorphomonas sp. T1.2MG-36 TaxID=3041167 RepID=UPI00247787B2|nr:NAD(P)H-binding protein [Pleomorphomonas sp. T1.2MG-36]CAI9414626.1 NAD(P)H azoreductase [Pleomorphomonas sp. T1.2MG-36]